MHEALARRLRMLRAERDWNIKEASERLGINRMTLAALEHGERFPHGATLHKLAKGYGLTPAELLEEESSPKEPTRLRFPPDLERLREKYADFETFIASLDLEELKALGHDLARQQKEALAPKEPGRVTDPRKYRMKDPARAFKLTAYRNLVAAQLEQLNPPYAEIITRADGSIEVTHLRVLTPEEREKLDAKVEELRGTGKVVEENRELVVSA